MQKLRAGSSPLPCCPRVCVHLLSSSGPAAGWTLPARSILTPTPTLPAWGVFGSLKQKAESLLDLGSESSAWT